MKETLIRRLRGRRVWDSRGRPTVEAEVELGCGATGRAIAPAGASTGSAEAVDLRDGGASFGGMDVRRAIVNVNEEIALLLAGMDARDQEAVDRRMIAADGTPNKARLGGNAMVAVSMAVLHAAAAAERVPLWRYLAQGGPVTMPRPEIQIFGGGAHAARRVDIQDFMVVCRRAGSFFEALDITAEIYRAAGMLLAERGLLGGVADEGGYWPAFGSNEEGIEMLVRAIEVAGYSAGVDAAISLDVAASQFGSGGSYRLARDGRTVDTCGMLELLLGWIERYPIVAVEDPFGEDDADGFRQLTAACGDRVQVIGDDLLATNAARIRKAGAEGACNAALIKPNQAGTVTETREAFAAARACGMGTIVSARSGETEDVTIVHLAAGWDARQLKVGSFSRSERMAKWNEGLRIEEALGSAAVLA